MSDNGWFTYADERRPCHNFRLPDYSVRNEPRTFRVSPGMQSKQLCLPKDAVYFRLGTRIVHASATPAHPSHPHVRRLHLRVSRIARLISLLTSLLPLFIGFWIQSAFPEWFLPPTIILKSERKELGGRFDVEAKAYRQLESLQGTVVPICYGIARCNQLRCLVLQDIGGVSLTEPAGLILDVQDLSRLLSNCYGELYDNGVYQEDTQLGNFRLVDNTIKAIDLEGVTLSPSAEKRDSLMEIGIQHLLMKYRDLQKRECEQGNLVGS